MESVNRKSLLVRESEEPYQSELEFIVSKFASLRKSKHEGFCEVSKGQVAYFTLNGEL